MRWMADAQKPLQPAATLQRIRCGWLHSAGHFRHAKPKTEKVRLCALVEPAVVELGLIRVGAKLENLRIGQKRADFLSRPFVFFCQGTRELLQSEREGKKERAKTKSQANASDSSQLTQSGFLEAVQSPVTKLRQIAAEFLWVILDAEHAQ